MQPANKTRIALVVGISLIISVASMVGLPFTSSQSSVQKVSHETITKLEASEEKILGFAVQEKAELESKMGGKINLP
ncbi:MAG: hypothetical protein HZA84_04900 [Thaumarchaeota archaeon]|nr:hypothetical protein [Nitrososphaerota archaeon]